MKESGSWTWRSYVDRFEKALSKVEMQE